MTLRDRRAFLWDMLQAARSVLAFTSGRTFEEYLGDLMLRSAVERQLEIVGEALRQMLAVFPESEATFHGAREIIAFRNRLARGYAQLDHEVVWGVVEEDLPALVEQLASALDAAPSIEP